MSMPSRRTLLAGLTFAVALGAAPFARAATVGSGTAATETRDLSGFAAIAMKGDIDVVVRQAARETVQVSTDANLLPLLQTVVEGSGDQRSLRIQWKAGESVTTRSRTVVTVEVVNLKAIALAGSGDLDLQALKTPSLTLSLSGSSDAVLRQLDTGDLRISVAGSGDVQARGKATRLDVSIAGSGDVQLRDLAADEVRVSIAGSGDASVSATRSLDVSIAGSGDVDYGGGVTQVRSQVVGSGTVRARK
jgi:Putative auto-transporter adhesin, head GIN domain